MSSAEAHEWQRLRSGGRRRFLARETFRGFVLFALTSGCFWWMGERWAIPGEFVRRMSVIGFLIWVGGAVRCLVDSSGASVRNTTSGGGAA